MEAVTPKPIEDQFADWEGQVFGLGYGTGEDHTILALKMFFGAFGKDGRPNCYDYRKLEEACTPAVAWLLINVLCHADVIEYGTSPRYGWLTPHGERLKAFIASKSVDELVEMATHHDEHYTPCYPDACNCGPNGYEEGRRCENAFWSDRTRRG